MHFSGKLTEKMLAGSGSTENPGGYYYLSRGHQFFLKFNLLILEKFFFL